MPDKLTDSEIVKACKDCLHYEPCKGTYSSAKGDEDILYDFDGEMYANSGCEDFEDKDLINRLQAENERLKDLYEKSAYEREMFLNELNDAKAEAYKEFAERLHEELRMYGIKDKFDKAVFLNVVDKAKKELVGDK